MPKILKSLVTFDASTIPAPNSVLKLARSWTCSVFSHLQDSDILMERQTSTKWPWRLKAMAAASPAIPAPTTTTRRPSAAFSPLVLVSIISNQEIVKQRFELLSEARSRKAHTSATGPIVYMSNLLQATVVNAGSDAVD